MDPVNGEPFQDHEKRYMLTEALRASSIPIDKLLNLLQEGGPPVWDNMLLPRGRTLSQCKAAYDLLRNVPPPSLHTFPAPIQPLQNVNPPKRKSDSIILTPSYMSGEPSAKRRQSGIETMVGARDIRPKPPNGGSPVSMASSPAAPPQKRRGRPPKTEVERKNREAMQRGELFPAHMPPAEEFATSATSPYAPIAPTPPSLAPGPPTPQGFIEHSMPVVQADDSPGRRKRVRAPPKPPKAPPPKQPGESSFSVNPQLPIVREPQVRQQVPSIATIAEMQPAPVSQPAVSASVIPSPLPPTIEAATSAEPQPPAEAAS